MINIQITAEAEDLIPTYARQGDAGADLKTAEQFEIAPGMQVMVRTGVFVAIPEGYVGLIHPRSGLAAKSQLTVMNAPGTIDSGYRGEIMILLKNFGESTVAFNRGDRVAQLVIQAVETAVFEVVDVLPDSERGEGGFGSTGVL